MKLTVLTENNTVIDHYLLGEPGLSFYLEEGGRKILFDTGYSDIFIRNGMKLGIDALDVDDIVLSHGHNDHTWGLQYWLQGKSERDLGGRKPCLVAHPAALEPKVYPGKEDLGCIVAKDSLGRFLDIKESKEPYWLTDRLVFLGEIPRKNDFEGKHSIGMRQGPDGWEADYLPDDSALVYKSEKGLVVITGCSHAGICNIIEYGMEITGERRIADIIGGLHLLRPSEEQMEGTLEYLFRLQPQQVHACHCTSLKAKILMAEKLDVHEVGVGMKFVYDEEGGNG